MTCRHGSPSDKCRICLLELQLESQKETIDDQYMTISTANIWNSKLKDELESLKAITELAVKGLKEVSDIVQGSNVSRGYLMRQIVDISEIVKPTLSEIARLQSEQT